MQITKRQTASGFKVTFHEKGILLAEMQVTFTEVNANDSSLEFIRCEVRQFLNGRAILQGTFKYANGRIAEVRNAPLVANWALRIAIQWLKTE
jgi:hypothetical protein